MTRSSKNKSKNILLIITGSVAAYKSVDLIRLFTKANHNLTPIMTKGAEEFITPLLVSSISGNRVFDKLFSSDDESKIGHINLSRQNDVIVVAPATADFIAKMANGLADDLASNVILAANKTIFVAPAMNEKMWLHKQTQKNLQTLRENGVQIIEPKSDVLACGEYGVGKMVEPLEIFTKINNFFDNKNKLNGKKVIITAGATYEPIDPVRFIGNYSSGKQGIKIAEKFSEYGADVFLIAGNIKENINLSRDKIIRVKTAGDMLESCLKHLNKTDIFISCAAVADFRPKEILLEKIKKEKQSLRNLELIENVDILKTIANHTNRPKIVIGFAAESSDLVNNAKDKLKSKNCDFVLANDIENGNVFGSDYNQITLLDRIGAVEKWEKMTKEEVAEKLIEKLTS